ncbi:MAG TPA: PAS domain S-box protein [Lacunisphaera sp.]|nr:PAS domain S-box protein [Lacunisphaera sp.]
MSLPLPGRDWLAVLAQAPGGFTALDGSLLGLVAVLALAAWLGRQGLRRRHRLDIEARLRQMSSLIEHADGVLWEAEVELTRDDWTWRMKLHPSAFCRRLFDDRLPQPRVDLWADFVIEQRADMDRRAREAIEAGRPGYEQEFRAVRGDQAYWLHESVSITRLETTRYWLVGLVTDVTARREAELARRESEQTIARILAQARCMIWRAAVVEEHGELDWRRFEMPRSQLTEELFGADWTFRPERGFWDRIRVPDLPAMNARSTQAIRQGAAGYTQQFTATTEAGRTFWLQEQVAITAVSPGVWALVGVIMDTTAQRQLEAARQASELRLQELLQRADCLLWEAEVELTPEAWTWGFEIQDSGFHRRLHGQSGPVRDTSLWRDFNIPEREEMVRRCRTAMESGRPGYEQVFHIVPESGPAVWIQEKVTIRPLGPGRYSLVGVATDITRQHEAELALANEKERLAVTLRAMTEAVITTDVAGTVLYLNPAATTLTQWGADEAIGRRVDEVCRFVPSHGDEPVRLPWDRVARGEIVADLPAHTELVSRDDRRRLVEGCCVPIHAAGSAVTGMVLVFRDVTEQERLEQELVRAARLESVGILAGGIAHDFNNILTGVMGNLTLAQMDADAGSELKDRLHEAEKATLRARDLTQQLLTFAKGGEPVRAAVRMGALIDETARFALHGSSVRLVFDLPEDLWAGDVDRGQLGRVIQNLVINAVQAMPADGILRIMARNETITRIDHAPPLEPGDYIRMEIADNGMGVKPENLGRIFDPYFTTKEKGSGLGLAAVYSIIRKHHGAIDVESEVGRGTTFRLWLPALRRAPTETAEPVRRESPRFSGRVLFMDDEESIRKMAGVMLRQLGFEVNCVAEGHAAVEEFQAARARGEPYTFVIMDLTVPGGFGGREAIRQLREIDPQVRAIVSSGYSSDPVLANHRAHGFCGVMAKPYQMEDVVRAIRAALAR